MKIWSGLVWFLLFNGISTLVGDSIPRVLIRKINVIAQLKLWNDFTVQDINQGLSYSLAHWAGTLFGRPCSLIRGSSRVCLGSGCSPSRPSDIDSGKLAFMSRTLRPALLENQGVVPPSSNPLGGGGARFIVWCQGRPFLGECWRGSRHLRNRRALVLRLVSTVKRPCAILARTWSTG